ncbi:MAG: hypothetical protein HKO56_03765, partial [Bacteroidia bacterium]|nr:hypothetical protein [Bacteroidia bacterium]
QRILRYDNPSSKANGANADAVLGQANFTSGSFAVTNHNVWNPQGMVMICNRFYVADGSNNRIVWWDNPSSKANGAFMDGVIGQSNFFNDYIGVAQDSLESPSALMADEEGRLYVADSWNFRLLVLNEPLTESYMTDFDVVLGQVDFDSKNWGVSRTRNTFIAESAILIDGDRKYLASTDVSANRVIVRGPVNLITDEDKDSSSVLLGSDPSGIGGLTFAITAQPTIGTVTLDNASTGEFTYHAPGVCGVDSNQFVPFQYAVTNANGCLKTSSINVQVREVAPCDEDCSNGIDDDGDGFTDCDDPDCGVSTIGYKNGQHASLVYGQPDFNSGAAGVSDSTFFTPSSIAVDPTTGKVFIAEASNHRVLRFASMSTLINNGKAEAVLGQSNFTNRIVGLGQNRMESPNGLAFDTLGNLFVSDNGNERVLRFDNASSKATYGNADGVLGKPNFVTNGSTHTQAGMGEPKDVVMDANGNLWVSDFNNYRVIKYNNASSKPNGALADVVLGNPDFTTAVFACTDSTLRTTNGIAISDGSLYVADEVHNRIMVWDNANYKSIGAKADRVLGQPDFFTSTATVSQTTIPDPEMLSNDDKGNLYVGSGNPTNRITIYENVKLKSFNAPADYVLGQPDYTSTGGGATDSTVFSPKDMVIAYYMDKTYMVLADGWNDRILFFGQSITTDELTAISDTLNGVDLAATGSLTFAIVQQTALGVVTIDNASLGTYTYTPTGPCMLSKDSVLTFKYSVTNGNGCAEIETLNILVTNDSSCAEICNNSLDDDGDGLIDCNDSTDCVPDTPGAISVSNDTLCAGASGETYSISAVAGATSYDWTVPAGATITAGQGTTSISVDWGTTSGNVCVRSYNGFCYSAFNCASVQVNDIPTSPPSIFH